MLLISSVLSMQNANAGRVIDPKIQSLGLLFTENMEVTSMTSVIYGRSDSSSALNYKICKTITDVVCTAATEIMIIQFFSLCDKPIDTNLHRRSLGSDSWRNENLGYLPASSSLFGDG